MDDGRPVNFDPRSDAAHRSRLCRYEPQFPGLTENRVLVNVDTKTFSELLNTRFAYVSVSRASRDAHIYTNDTAMLAERLSTDVTKTSAVGSRHVPGPHSHSQIPKEHAMQQRNELKLEPKGPQTPRLTAEQIEHNRQYGCSSRSPRLQVAARNRRYPKLPTS
jgi:hypothetical protein